MADGRLLTLFSTPHRFLLPINEKRISFVSTEATDYPESNFSEFNTVCQLAKNFISRWGTYPSNQIRFQTVLLAYLPAYLNSAA